ncbi:MAG: HipA domain-containing protein, partial [Bacteroidota bacterium]
MSLPEINYCPSLLSEGFHSYSPAALKKLFDGKKVSHILPYDAPWTNDDESNDFMENRKRISISGVQEKYSLIQVKNKLRLTEPGEQGTHILKPYPVDLKRPRELPANEHLTMQIASQVYKLNTASSGMIFFKNGDPAYITKRFDVLKNGTKLAKEDFATLAGKKGIKSGPDFKYEGSYEKAGNLIKQFVPAQATE